MKKFIQLLKENKQTIAFAESMTGGLLSYEITKTPGASKVFMGSIVSYHKQVKTDLLDVQKSTIDTYGIVSSKVAVEMAKQARNKMHASIGVGVTGDAGPTLQKGSTKRLAIYAICNDKTCEIHKIIFDKESRYKAQKRTKDEIYKSLDLFVKKNIV